MTITFSPKKGVCCAERWKDCAAQGTGGFRANRRCSFPDFSGRPRTPPRAESWGVAGAARGGGEGAAGGLAGERLTWQARGPTVLLSQPQ